MLDTPAKNVRESELNEVLGSGYGIFSGKKVAWATLRFSPERSRWVATERWHPKQEGRALVDGRYELRVPYADHRELIMDILKHGRHCEVVGPKALREKVIAEMKESLTGYRKGPRRKAADAD